jgi:hypothetical protein
MFPAQQLAAEQAQAAAVCLMSLLQHLNYTHPKRTLSRHLFLVGPEPLQPVLAETVLRATAPHLRLIMAR